MSDINYKILTQYPDEGLLQKWYDFLENASFASSYVSPNYFLDPFQINGEKFAILGFDQNGRTIAVLTGIDGGKEIVSGLAVSPQTCFRKDANRSEAVKSLFEGLREKGGRDLELINLYTWEPIREFEDLGFQTEISKGANLVMMLDLSKGAEDLFKEFSQTRRNELRKAIKQNTLVIKELETNEEFRELYEIYVDWNLRKGHQPNSFEVMQIAVAQKEYRKVLIAKHEGKVIAGSYYRFCEGGLVEYAANNSLTEFQNYRPNDLIGWHSIQWACEAGFSHYSMGGSHLFLRRFGGDEWATHNYQFDCTFFKTHTLKKNARHLGLKIYQNLPMSMRTNIKKFFGKG